MATQVNGSDRGAENPACPLHSQSNSGATNANGDWVDWAGLPVRLELAFSQNQRDKVYAQYVKRRRDADRGAIRDVSQVCVCNSDGNGYFTHDVHRSVSNL